MGWKYSTPSPGEKNELKRKGETKREENKCEFFSSQNPSFFFWSLFVLLKRRGEVSQTSRTCRNAYKSIVWWFRIIRSTIWLIEWFPVFLMFHSFSLWCGCRLQFFSSGEEWVPETCLITVVWSESIWSLLENHLSCTNLFRSFGWVFGLVFWGNPNIWYFRGHQVVYTCKKFFISATGSHLSRSNAEQTRGTNCDSGWRRNW